MKTLILILLCSCGMTQRPGDILGPGTACENITEFKQHCTDRYAQKFVCTDSGGRWNCRGPIR